MDRSRTREELERLAELYLTDISAPEETGGNSSAAQPASQDSPGQAPADSLNSAEVGPHIEVETVVSPIRLAPHLRGQTPSSSETVGESESGPEINVSHPAPIPYPMKKARAGTTGDDAGDEKQAQKLIQGILPSHLPGIASPWLGQYANMLAKEYGCVVVLRVDPCTIEIDTYTYADGDTPEPEHFQFPMEGDAPVGDKVTNHDDQPLLRVLHRISRIAGAWLVHLPDPLNRFESTVAQDLVRWCVLSSADDAALLNTYRMLKTLLSRLPEAGVSPRELQFTAMGADEPGGVAATTKLDQALEAFLNVNVSFGGAVRRMKPVRRETVGHYSPNGHPWVVLREFFNDIAPQMLVHEDERSDELETGGSVHLTNAPTPPPEPTPTPEQETLEPISEQSEGVDMTLGGESDKQGEPMLKLKPSPASEVDGSKAGDGGHRPVGEDENPIADIDLNEVFDKPERKKDGVSARDSGRKAPPRVRVPLTGNPFEATKPEDPDQPLHRFPTPLTEAEINALTEDHGTDEGVSAEDVVQADASEKTGRVESWVTDDTEKQAEKIEKTEQAEKFGSDSGGEPEVVVKASVEELKQCALQLASMHLSQFLPELTPLVARSPRHRQIEIAIDSAGQLHLLIYADGLSSDEAIRRLMQTYHWATEHAELLGLTLKDQRLEMDVQPVLHLFTNEPRYAADFVFTSPEETRQMQLHLLQPVIMNQQATCVHARIS